MDSPALRRAAACRDLGAACRDERVGVPSPLQVRDVAEPLQYQKQVRLLRAHVLLVEGKRVTTAASEVGYESSNQFRRKHGRLFGQSPARDAERFLGELRRRPWESAPW